MFYIGDKVIGPHKSRTIDICEVVDRFTSLQSDSPLIYKIKHPAQGEHFTYESEENLIPIEGQFVASGNSLWDVDHPVQAVLTSNNFDKEGQELITRIAELLNMYGLSDQPAPELLQKPLGDGDGDIPF